MQRPFILIDTLSDIDHEQIKGRALGASEYQFYSLVASLGTTCYNNGPGPRYVGNILYDNIANAEIPENAIILLMRTYPYTNRALTSKLANHTLIQWVQDTPGDHLVDRTYTGIPVAKAAVLGNARHYFVANSQSCGRQLLEYFGPTIADRVFVIPNALYDDEFATDLSPSVDLNRIVYASAWCKGIAGVIAVFDYVFRHDPDFRLTLMNPGYDNMAQYEGLLADIRGRYGSRIEVLGPQSRLEFSRIVAGSLCTMTARFNETFGCVFAESMALGTPVVADIHSGAVREYAGEDAVVDYARPEQVLERLRSLRDNRVCRPLSNKYRVDAVMLEWHTLLTKLSAER